MKYLKKAMIWGLIGIPVGVFIGQLFALVFAGVKGGRLTTTFGDMLVQFVLCSAVGLVFSSMSVVFSVEKWSLLKQTVIYFAVTLGVYLSCAIMAGWIPAKLWSVIGFIVIFIFIFVCIWLSFYFYNKHKIKLINRAIESKQSK